MSVLKKIGIILATIGTDVTKFLGLPFISQLLGMIPGKLGQTVGGVVQKVETTVGDLSSIAQFIAIAEAMMPSIGGAKTGSAKLAATSPLVQKEILVWAQSNLPGHNKVITSPEAFAAHCKAFTSDFADILNDFGE